MRLSILGIGWQVRREMISHSAFVVVSGLLMGGSESGRSGQVVAVAITREEAQ